MESMQLTQATPANEGFYQLSSITFYRNVAA